MSTERAAPYGNYKGYYTKRGNHFSDPRLRALPPGLFKGKRVLDVGCNEGWVTCEIALCYDAQEVVGVDIDAELVGRAWRHRREVWSLQSPKISLKKDSSDKSRDELPESSSLEEGANSAYFPDCFPSLFGPVPIQSQSSAFPNNVSFHQSDWANLGCSADELGYNVVVAFSVSKWIHVHNGDEGIKRFFSRVKDVLASRPTGAPPGVFVLEAQPWSGYHNAMRKANLHKPKEQKPLESLKLSPAEFPAFLSELGFSKPKRAGIIGEGGFQRPIDIYELQKS
ncbi:7SK snRNA methylphosphate capping enzyme OS=Mus musculus GN=Mepce PE=1 SV=2 [Rhizoctonia solani AG-1 IB]|uniref:RNA methyltransferase n=1 Tax=Thanatephorus cucumeris (strain AG1-IB / isolate 7/3/14) TaxID=1108050 RepID=A0A0B7FZJ3_THACB|nr:7SK snRNA methylphosphate capping enzyme OS=Mus musculus GN=Mepce PE=1 SV=2 [Rhizoctonia solani AG-1 IB]